MSPLSVSPWDIFGKRLPEEIRALFEKMVFYINNQAQGVVITNQMSVSVNLNQFAELLRDVSKDVRRRFLALLRVKYLGANPPWGEVWFTASFPRNREKKATLTIYLNLDPGRYCDLDKL